MGVGAGVRSDNRHDSNHPRLARRTEGRRAWPDLASSSGHICRPPRPVKPLSRFSEPRVYVDARVLTAGALGAGIALFRLLLARFELCAKLVHLIAELGGFLELQLLGGK